MNRCPNVVTAARLTLSLGLVLLGWSGTALAIPPTVVPEIGGTAMASTMMLLAGGALILVNRVRRK
ncbi:MAG: hypothetical protein U0746_08980 [Gemmataceae bacterium]